MAKKRKGSKKGKRQDINTKSAYPFLKKLFG